jgi:hypothetical protein
MQAITIAIGKAGINFFAQQLVAKELVNLLSGLKPPDKTISIGHINIAPYSSADNIVIKLTQGKLLNFSPAFQSITQQSGGNFPLVMAAGNFSAQYSWQETYVYTHCTYMPKVGTVCDNPENKNNTFTYTPDFSQLTVNIPLQFEYDSQNQKWSIVAGTSSGNAVTSHANIPSGSVIQQEDQECFSSHVSDATASALSAIDFSSSLNSLIAGNIASIPGSGDLGNGIVYDFSLGDSGLLFPDNDGIQMGVKGGASYNGAPFSGDTPPSLSLPLPPSDADAHHLNMYVSNYEVDALNWAYFEAGLLNLLIKPQDLPDPQLLKVSSYVSYEPSLAPYTAFVMYAQITQNSAPVTSFQTVYLFSKAVMNLLQTQLPANIYQLIQGIAGNAYLSQADVENFLTEATVPNQYFATIENAAKTMAMALTQDISYTLTIQNNGNPQPNIKFSVRRTDVLTNLGLGVSVNNTQTLQFGFANADNAVKYESSSIPGFNGPIFETIVWVIAEGMYAQNLADLGKIGVPLPIMRDFQFDFENAQLSIQNGYVSILANVNYKE